MKYLITLTPLEPFLFGGDTTFGAYANKEEGSYLVQSTRFPQQSAILGMLKKEIMIQAGYLTRKRKGEWVDAKFKVKAEILVGKEKFDITKRDQQSLGAIKNISPVFLLQDNQRYIKKVDIDGYPYENDKLKNYTSKIDIYNNYISIDNKHRLTSKDIWESVEQIGNKKDGTDNALFKKTSYKLMNNFKFAFYLECDFELKASIVHLGADRSSFQMEVTISDDALNHQSKGYITLLSDAYITQSIDCNFAITSEISYRSITGSKHVQNRYENNKFHKCNRIFLYEKGSIFINPSNALIANLNNPNLQQIGYNIFSSGAEK